jgi:hypothetical protein
MNIRMYPIEFEIADEVGEVMARVRCFDEHTSEVTIKTFFTMNLWDEVAGKVTDALKQIHEAME